MAKQIMQFRYYNENATTASKNQPRVQGYGARLKSGSLFSNYTPITQLGIQTLPGVKFYLNNSNTPIIIGSTGIYELNLEGLSEITALKFDYGSVDTIAKNDNAYLIIDIIYEGEGA